MKKFLSLLLSLLLCIFILPLSGCTKTSAHVEFDEPPVFDIPPEQLTVDWEKAFQNAFQAFSSSEEYDYSFSLPSLNGSYLFQDSPTGQPCLRLSMDIPILSQFLDEAFGPIGKNSELLSLCSLLLKELNLAAQQQDSRITDAGSLTYGGIYDVLDLVLTVSSDGTTLLEDTLKAGEQRKRFLLSDNAALCVQEKVTSQLLCDYFTADRFPKLHSFSASLVTDTKIGDEIQPAMFFAYMYLEDGSSDRELQQYSEELLCVFQQICQRQDPRLAEASATSYGGAFDSIQMMVLTGIHSPTSEQADQDGNVSYYRLYMAPGKYKSLEECKLTPAVNE